MSDSTRKIIKYAKSVLEHGELLHESKIGKFYIGKVGQGKNLCHIGIVEHPKGILIETSFPQQKGVHNRIWMLEPYLEQVSYLETDNPNLKKNANIFDYYDPAKQSQEIEMYAMPNDLELLTAVLELLAGNPVKYSAQPSSINASKSGLYLAEGNII